MYLIMVLMLSVLYYGAHVKCCTEVVGVEGVGGKGDCLLSPGKQESRKAKTLYRKKAV